MLLLQFSDFARFFTWIIRVLDNFVSEINEVTIKKKLLHVHFVAHRLLLI